ncbi:DUF983 domain-containing protein [Phenylobacterium sp. SCN 70-31]|uniref:DUF983 domain-containing protein n=1 Tax=Phenylobacterium sp. SCN 70-31 TaxID=1660129 RepID=UPI000869CF22|nr:DUF983 domain-containing protein [Phenylobacterium sp. SCN 70-31]ODT88637.1 MAG: hypothetical protein ABS78_05605 [Phenylobacterium sp. SCN 70-31]
MAEIAYPLFRSIGRGLRQRCPCCGDGRLFGRYLKVEPACAVCAHTLQKYPADDGPAYLTILLVGHLIVAPLLIFPIVWEAPPYYSLPIILGALTGITLVALPRIKGLWIGLMYSLQVTDKDQKLHTADAAD